jgi:hypothetical protein
MARPVWRETTLDASGLRLLLPRPVSRGATLSKFTGTRSVYQVGRKSEAPLRIASYDFGV